MAALIANKPPKLFPVHHDDANSGTDTDDDDDLSLCDLPIRAPSFTAGINAVAGTSHGRLRNETRVPSSTVSVDADFDDNDPFEFFSASRHGNGTCSPSDVFYGGRMFPTQAAPPPPPAASTSSALKAAANFVGSRSTSFSSCSESNPASYSGVLPPFAMSRRSRSEGVRRPPRDPAVYNRSASVEGRGRARISAGTAGRKGDYRRLPPLHPAAPVRSSSEQSAGSYSTGSTKKTSGGGTITCTVDPVPSCGPRPKWYVFATFASVKPPQGEMDMKDIRTRQKKRNTQQDPAAATARLGAGAGAGAGAGGRRGRKSWLLLNSLSCKVDVDALAWTPSDPPMPLPELPHHEAPRWR